MMEPENQPERMRAIAFYCLQNGRDGDAAFLYGHALKLEAEALQAARFKCNVDESAGLAEIHSLDPHSRRV